MKNNEHYQQILKMISKLTYSRDTWEIFYDFLEMTAICISNTIDLNHFDEREKQYLSTINKYTPEHQKIFSEMFAQLLLALEYEWQVNGFVDILGCLFHELELHDKYKGQFFTPQHLCSMMGKILLGDNEKTIQTQGFINISEPTCGSGAMLLGFAQAMKDSGYNHSQQMLVSAVDIDLKCVYMSYIQLSLYGIPAIVIHGNSLTAEEWSYWYTPVYVLDGWRWKNKVVGEGHKEPTGEVQSNVSIPTIQQASQSYEQLDIFKTNEGE